MKAGEIVLKSGDITMVIDQGKHTSEIPRGTGELLVDIIRKAKLTGSFKASLSWKCRRPSIQDPPVVIKRHNQSGVMVITRPGGSDSARLFWLKDERIGESHLPPHQLCTLLKETISGRKEIVDSKGGKEGEQTMSEVPGQTAKIATDAGETIVPEKLEADNSAKQEVTAKDITAFFREEKNIAQAIDLVLGALDKEGYIPQQEVAPSILTAMEVPHTAANKKSTGPTISSFTRQGYLVPVNKETGGRHPARVGCYVTVKAVEMLRSLGYKVPGGVIISTTPETKKIKPAAFAEMTEEKAWKFLATQLARKVKEIGRAMVVVDKEIWVRQKLRNELNDELKEILDRLKYIESIQKV